jgi:hypothetical protein
MSPLLRRIFTYFCWLFVLCFHLPCTFDGWILILDFDLQGFDLFILIFFLGAHPSIKIIIII